MQKNTKETQTNDAKGTQETQKNWGQRDTKETQTNEGKGTQGNTNKLS